MQFGYTILYVKNVYDTISFYEKAFGLTLNMVTESGEFGELATGDTKLAFASSQFIEKECSFKFEQASLEKIAPPIEIGFITQDVTGAYEKAIAAGATEVSKPVQKPWGQFVGFVRDCNGYLVEICSPVV